MTGEHLVCEVTYLLAVLYSISFGLGANLGLLKRRVRPTELEATASSVGWSSDNPTS